MSLALKYIFNTTATSTARACVRARAESCPCVRCYNLDLIPRNFMYVFRPQWRFFRDLTSQALWIWMTRGSCSCPHNSKPSHALFWWTADLLWSSAFGAQCGTRSESLTDSFTSDWDPRLRVERSVPCMDDHSEARTLISFCNVAWRSRFYLKVLSALAFTRLCQLVCTLVTWVVRSFYGDIINFNSLCVV